MQLLFSYYLPFQLLFYRAFQFFRKGSFLLFPFFFLLSINTVLLAQSAPKDSIAWWIDSTEHLPEAAQKSYLEQALNVAKANQFHYEHALVLAKLAGKEMDQANYAKSLSFLDTMRQLINTYQFDDLRGNQLQLRGNNLLHLKQNKRAQQIFEEALVIYDTQADSLGKALIYNNLGNLNFVERKYAEALIYYQKANAIFQIFDKTKFANGALSNIALIYLFQEKPEEALIIFKQLLSIYTKSTNLLSQSKAYGNIAYSHFLLKNYPKALDNYQASIDIAKREGYNDVLAVTYKDLSETYAAKGDTKNALAIFQKYHDLHIKNVGEKTQKEVSALQVKYDTEVKNRQLSEQAKTIETLEQSQIIRRQRFILLSSLLGSLALVAMFLYLRQQTKLKQIQATKSLKEQILQKELALKEQQRKLLQTELENKNKDITTLALDISRKNDFSKMINQELEQLEKGLPKAYQSKVRQLKMNTLGHLEINEDVANLQNNIEQANHQFYENLDKIAKLSQSEKQICGLIRMNLSNKQIAIIRNTTTDSTKVFRYRIRKKIGLQPEDDVVSFLQNI